LSRVFMVSSWKYPFIPILVRVGLPGCDVYFGLPIKEKKTAMCRDAILLLHIFISKSTGFGHL
jgi:hypothetical protein